MKPLRACASGPPWMLMRGLMQQQVAEIQIRPIDADQPERDQGRKHRDEQDAHIPAAGPRQAAQDGERGCFRAHGAGGGLKRRGGNHGHTPSFIMTDFATSVLPVKIANMSAMAAVEALADMLTVTLGTAQFCVAVTVKLTQLGSPVQA